MKGGRKALTIFRQTAKQVPAYQRFLKKRGVRPDRIRTMDDFRTLPLTNKQNYIHHYSLRSLFANSRIPPVAYASSGSSGQPTFWFRNEEQERLGGELHGIIFEKTFQLRSKEPTLVIVCFSMGIWVAGMYTVAACRYLTGRGFELTIIPPGIEREDIFLVLRNLAPRFKNVVLIGYPPFVMDILNESHRRDIALKSIMKIITAGDKASEDWRSSILALLNSRNTYRSVVNIYGSADAGVMGYETPLSIFLRRKALSHQALYRALFGDALPSLPGLFQYHPDKTFFEAVQGELVLTTRTAAPLIRYNTHDVGGTMTFEHVRKLMDDFGLTEEARRRGFLEWRLPFLTVSGRTDVAVTFYALNILHEHIKAGVEDARLSRFLSGKFLAYNRELQAGRKQKLYLKLELAPGIKLTKKLAGLASQSIFEQLMTLNMEFRKLYSVMGRQALPTISFYPYGANIPQHKSGKGILYVRGKKPRMIGVS